MFMKYSQGGKVGHGFSKYIVEEESELSKAPVNCGFGDIVYVVHTSEYWMMDRSKRWYPMAANGKGAIECDCIEEMTIWGNIPEPTN